MLGIHLHCSALSFSSQVAIVNIAVASVGLAVNGCLHVRITLESVYMKQEYLLNVRALFEHNLQEVLQNHIHSSCRPKVSPLIAQDKIKCIQVSIRAIHSLTLTLDEGVTSLLLAPRSVPGKT
jgi:hypothetical protein